MPARQDRRAEHQPEDARRFDRGQLLDQRDARRAKQRAERAAGDGEHQRIRSGSGGRCVRGSRRSRAAPRSRAAAPCRARAAGSPRSRTRSTARRRRPRAGREVRAAASRRRDLSGAAPRIAARSAESRWRATAAGCAVAHERGLFDRGLQRHAGRQPGDHRDSRRTASLPDSRAIGVKKSSGPVGNSKSAGSTPTTVSSRGGMGASNAPVRNSSALPTIAGSAMKVALPRVVAEHDDVGIGLVARPERASQHRVDVQQRRTRWPTPSRPTVPPRLRRPHHSLRHPDDAPWRRRASSCARASREIPGCVMPRCERSGPARCEGRGVLDDAHQPIGIRERQRLQQDRVDHAVDRRGRADADRERQDGGDGEAAAARQRSHRIRDISSTLSKLIRTSARSWDRRVPRERAGGMHATTVTTRINSTAPIAMARHRAARRRTSGCQPRRERRHAAGTPIADAESGQPERLADHDPANV